MSNYKNIIAIRRNYIYSLNAAQRDADILLAVIQQLDANIRIVDETKLTAYDKADMYISMARHPSTLAWLSKYEKQGAKVINKPQAVEACTRKRVVQLMRQHHVPMPPIKGENGYWLKRADAQAQLSTDVVYCKDEKQLDIKKQEWLQRGIKECIASAHVDGDLIKFYCVGNNFFKWYQRKTVEGGYAFNAQYLHQEAKRFAHIIGIDIYGGDCIVDRNGNISIIDFNDWPSFAACKEQAAKAIAQIIKDRYEQI